ncbi:hypothetical protein KHA90_16360 [Flavobacterium psychroterrae]|uniref:Uncharacterized protein n=2 Tax=Flavobacterium psychroterrae TaxID=2133767 RepID=A0ABS5PE85_9FLAO|nr:hypothetical protein [Flavobacterium psychroterrae]MBS7232592.1 hypothetical protein [Flavobacterium psychroterrae]
MMKKIFLASLFLSSLYSFSQEIVSSTPVEFKKNVDVFQTVNNDNNKVTLFMSDKIKVKAIQLNEKMQVADSISIERPDTKIYKSMIGYNISNDNTRLFWSSSDSDAIFSQLFDFNSRKVVTKQYALVLKNEKVLQQFSENDNFYILSVIKKSNNLKLHIFDKNGDYNEKTISLDGFHFFKLNYIKSDLYGVLEQNLLAFEPPFSLPDINVNNPTSLNETAKRRKCYFDKKQLVITIDLNVDFTQVIIIDLEKFTAAEKIIKSTSISKLSSSGFQKNISSNSFFIDNKLYQIKTSSDEFYFTIKDLEGNLIKEYTTSSETPIEFKNSEITQEGGDFSGSRTLETSSQFLRKINNLNTGISCYHIGENILVTFGGISGPKQSGGQAALGQFGFIGSIMGNVFFNPTMDNFNAYANKKVVKIDGLFDKEGNHIKGDLQPLAFDKIRTFFDKNNDVSAQILFKIKDYYLGYYDNKTKEYIIRKFND